MPSPIIEINKLTCSYSLKEEEKVLYIENLQLYSGKIIFLLGSSGTGKSTLLETIGLMNNTIASGSVKLFTNESIETEYATLWHEENEEQLKNFRKNFLSFIFQNTNLMENFTAYENICISQMIKSNSPKEKAMEGARNLMQQVGLGNNEVGENTLAVNLSGGQRQRISFVRALNTNFSLLLCDEPTGNLDEINANELLNIVKQNLTDTRSAIIVSHDINLALKYADEIILITKNPEKGFGEVLPENIFNRNYWEQFDAIASLQFKDELLKGFQSDKKGAKSNNQPGNNTKNYKGYYDLFIQKESKVLLGKSKSNLMVITAIIFLTFLAIGFANGSLKYLNTKLNDKFVNWITVGIPWAMSRAEVVDDITEKLNAKEIRNRFKIDTVTTFKQTSLPLFDNAPNTINYWRGRLIAFDDPLKEALFDSSDEKNGNYTRGTFFKNEQDLGIIVTEKLLKGAGYPLNTNVIYMDNGDTNFTIKPLQSFRVPIPVRGVLKEIPGRNQFLITEFFYRSRVNDNDNIFDFKTQDKRLLFYTEGDLSFAKSFVNEIEKIKGRFILKETIPAEEEVYSDSFSTEDQSDLTSIETSSESSIALDTLMPDSALNDTTIPKTKETIFEVDISTEDECEIINDKGCVVKVSLDKKPLNYYVTENIFQQIIQLPFYKKNQEKIIRIFDFGIGEQTNDPYQNDYLCINFKGGKGGLDSVASFSKYLSNTFNEGAKRDKASDIEVDSGIVKEKNNFRYLSSISILMAFLLIVFAICSISLFISNLLNAHLAKVKMNLGTFKAFGLSDKESKSIYMTIMVRFVLMAIIIAFALASIAGLILNITLKNYFNLEDTAEYFLLINKFTFILIALILAITALVSYLNINRILSKTPGDLIYNR